MGLTIMATFASCGTIEPLADKFEAEIAKTRGVAAGTADALDELGAIGSATYMNTIGMVEVAFLT